MKKFKIILAMSSLVLIIHSCQPSSENSRYYTEESSDTLSFIPHDSISFENAEVPLSSTAATFQDQKRKFIRTADLSMDVENVYQTTTNIESKVSTLGGFVTNSQLNSNVYSTETFPIDSDSAMEVKKFTVSNQMTVRIPHQELGNFLIALGKEMKFLNFRNISADDVSLDFILAELEKSRLTKSYTKLDKLIDEKGKIEDKENVITSMDDNQSHVNYQKLNTLKMKDEVEFSTVKIFLSEKEKVAENVVVNAETIDNKYKPKFGYRAKSSIKEGFYLFQNLLIGILYLWPLWFLSVIVFLFIKFQWKKTKKA